MFCRNCGNQIDDNTKVCPYCGANVSGAFGDMEQAIDSMSSRVDAEVNRAIDSFGQSFNPNYGNYGGPRFLKTDRSILIFFLLNLITCGIYGFFFVHNLAKDVNEACKDPYETTPGVGMFILTWLIASAVGFVLNMFNAPARTAIEQAIWQAQNGYSVNWFGLTSSYSALMLAGTITSIIAGFYPLYWRFKLGNKLQRNAQQYGMVIPENGSTVLIWDIVGIVCCCLGSWYAWYILLKNTNLMCMAYNNKYVINNRN